MVMGQVAVEPVAIGPVGVDVVVAAEAQQWLLLLPSGLLVIPSFWRQ